MPKFIVEWSMSGAAEIEADTAEEARAEFDANSSAYVWDSDLEVWGTIEKITRDKHEQRIQNDTVSGDGGMRNEHDAGRPVGNTG